MPATKQEIAERMRVHHLTWRRKNREHYNRKQLEYATKYNNTNKELIKERRDFAKYVNNVNVRQECKLFRQILI